MISATSAQNKKRPRKPRGRFFFEFPLLRVPRYFPFFLLVDFLLDEDFFDPLLDFDLVAFFID